VSIIEVVRSEPLPVAQRIEQQRRVIARTLRRFREGLERDAAGEAWEVMEVPAGVLLGDVCDALGLDPGQRREVLGKAGAGYLDDLQGERAWLARMLADVPTVGK
jgi:hypothetical protein